MLNIKEIIVKNTGIMQHSLIKWLAVNVKNRDTNQNMFEMLNFQLTDSLLGFNKNVNKKVQMPSWKKDFCFNWIWKHVYEKNL